MAEELKERYEPFSKGTTTVLDCLLVERARQKAVKRFDEAHDDDHTDGSLAKCAGMIVREPQDLLVLADREQSSDGWAAGRALHVLQKYALNRRQQLVIAGALIVAEIERIDRANAQTMPTSPDSPSPQSPPATQEPSEKAIQFAKAIANSWLAPTSDVRAIALEVDRVGLFDSVPPATQGASETAQRVAEALICAGYYRVTMTNVSGSARVRRMKEMQADMAGVIDAALASQSPPATQGASERTKRIVNEMLSVHGSLLHFRGRCGGTGFTCEDPQDAAIVRQIIEEAIEAALASPSLATPGGEDVLRKLATEIENLRCSDSLCCDYKLGFSDAKIIINKYVHEALAASQQSPGKGETPQ